tara:strand:+ start:12382 stop:13899 length:1518 start_codon:yes stop_codon:yes gene_type:complete
MKVLKRLDLSDQNYGACSGPNGWYQTKNSGNIVSINPSNGEPIAEIFKGSTNDYKKIINDLNAAFLEWRKVPAPKRGQVIKTLGNALFDNKKALGELVSIEMGKILEEGLGEVQEMIDIADFSLGQSRMLYGKTMHSERSNHRMYEQWHPLGVVGIISAFNFPVAVWAWNACIAAICGNTTIWKPSSSTPLTAIAVQKICNEVILKEDVPPIFGMIIGDGSKIGEKIINDSNVKLVSFTGSTSKGRYVNQVVSKRFGKTILELGGNNCIIVDESADMDIVIPSIVFGAVGTAGQRCTSTRRILIHTSRYAELIDRLLNAYKQIKIGDPLDKNTLMGPLINSNAVKEYENAIKQIKKHGGEVLFGSKVLNKKGFFVEPTIIKAENEWPIVKVETFAPLLYIIKFKSFDEAIKKHNDVPQGLSSSLFTLKLRNAEKFLSSIGSDCGIANINIGTSGAEIGGAFGGEKDTGGGRESGSDSWRQYMRRQTNTINWSSEIPLAQGIKFKL